MSTTQFISLFTDKTERRRIGFCQYPEPETEVKKSNSQTQESNLNLCKEYTEAILSSFQEWFQSENAGGLLNQYHDTILLNKINAARLLYKNREGGEK